MERKFYVQGLRLENEEIFTLQSKVGVGKFADGKFSLYEGATKGDRLLLENAIAIFNKFEPGEDYLHEILLKSAGLKWPDPENLSMKDIRRGKMCIHRIEGELRVEMMLGEEAEKIAKVDRHAKFGVVVHTPSTNMALFSSGGL